MNRQKVKKILRRTADILFKVPYAKRIFLAVLPESLTDRIFYRLGIPSLKPGLSREGLGILKKLKDIRSGRA